MSSYKAHAKISFAWWWRPYLYGLIATVWLTGMEPDWGKVRDKLNKAMRARIFIRKE